MSLCRVLAHSICSFSVNHIARQRSGFGESVSERDLFLRNRECAHTHIHNVYFIDEIFPVSLRTVNSHIKACTALSEEYDYTWSSLVDDGQGNTQSVAMSCYSIILPVRVLAVLKRHHSMHDTLNSYVNSPSTNKWKGLSLFLYLTVFQWNCKYLP